MTTLTDIANRALQVIGTRTTVTDGELAANSTNEAIQINLAYDTVRKRLILTAALLVVSPVHAETALEFAAAGMGRVSQLAPLTHKQKRFVRRVMQAESTASAPLDIRTAPQIVADAVRYVGTRNPYRFRGPGCKVFVNMVARASGYYANASARAIDVALMGRRISHPVPGAYRYSARRGGGHVELVAYVNGNEVVTINGNKGGNRVGWSHRHIAGARYYMPIRTANL